MKFSLFDWLFGWNETVQLRVENADLQAQLTDALESLAHKHNLYVQEVYRRQVAERRLDALQKANSGPLRLQPIVIYPPGQPSVPVEPVSEAFRQASDWCAEELGQPVFKVLPLIVIWSLRPLANFQANMIAECRQVVWDDLKMPLPPAPQPHVVYLVRGMGGFAQTVATDWQAPIVGLGDACLEALAGVPGASYTRDGQMGALAHEVCWHGLTKAREPELGYTYEGHPQSGSPEEAISISGGNYYLFPNVHFTAAEKRLILENLKGD